MITKNRWKHILGVARKAVELALKLRPRDILLDFCRTMR